MYLVNVRNSNIMKRLSFILLLIVSANSKSTAQITFIPDYRFEKALIDLGIDSDQIVNGQMLTNDALLVSEMNLSPATLPNYPYPAIDFYEGMIHDISGIEAFINLEYLKLNVTMIENLNLVNLTKLKYLDCVDNMLTSLNVSNNPLLEYLDISGGGDVLPVNNISEIDLTNNPNINTLKASGVDKINLHNNNNAQSMSINVSCNYCWDYPPDFIVGSVCMEVDNVESAQNNQSPYSEWSILHSNINVNYTDDLSQCALSTLKFHRNDVAIYPNPNQTGIVYLKSKNETIYKIMIFDLLGRKMIEENKITDNINISSLKNGNYFLKIISSKGSQTEKLIVE